MRRQSRRVHRDPDAPSKDVHHVDAQPVLMSEVQARLPDGKLLAMPDGSTVLDVAAQIGPGLAKAALAGRVDGELRFIWVDDVADGTAGH